MSDSLLAARKARHPANAVKVAAKDSSAVAFLYNDHRGNPVAAIYRGREVKPTAYRFGSESHRAKYITDQFKNIALSEKRRAERKAEEIAKRNAPHSLKVGDILVCSWGWEQTNVDYYQVVALVGKNSVSLRKITGDKTYTNSMSGTVTPVADSFVGDAFTKRVKGSYNAVKMTDYSTAYKYEGGTNHFSEYA